METWNMLRGEVTTATESGAVRFRVDCRPPCEPTRLLRCYGTGGERDLLIGVVEPKNGRLTLERRISRETLRQAGFDAPPEEFYLSDGGEREKSAPAEAVQAPDEVLIEAENAEGSPEMTENDGKSGEIAENDGECEREIPREPLKTGDTLLDAAIAGGAVRAKNMTEGVRLSCPFSPGQAFPLAFAAVLCRVEGDTAVLDWKTQLP